MNVGLLLALAGVAMLLDSPRYEASGVQFAAMPFFGLVIIAASVALFVLAARGQPALPATTGPAFLLFEFLFGGSMSTMRVLMWITVGLIVCHATILVGAHRVARRTSRRPSAAAERQIR